MVMKVLSDYERGYIEAFIDSDGSISVYRNSKNPDRFRPRVDVCFHNNCLEVLDKIAEMLGLETRIYKKQKSNRVNPSYTLKVTKKIDQYELLRQLQLVVKEERRKIALKVLELDNFGRNSRELSEKYIQNMNILLEEYRPVMA